ncbi:MAG: TIGR02186 family protein [Nitrospirae bacterium]|nr:TIGR02186 family protein [Nitrospirota bacterium]
MRQFRVQRAIVLVRERLNTIGLIMGVILSLAAAQDASAELTAKANHDRVKVGFFYHGSSVSVRGVSDPGTDLIVKIASPEQHQMLRKKGKIGGVLWMNVGSITLEQAPAAYFLGSTKKIGEILSGDEMDRNAIGYEALAKRAKLDPAADEQEKAKWFGEFVKYKESSHLYSAEAGKVTVVEKDGKQEYYILMDWPYQAAPEKYTVTVYAAKDGKVIETAEANVLVEQVGIVKSFADMAKNKAALYGLISILAALAAGFGVGMIFRKGGGAH